MDYRGLFADPKMKEEFLDRADELVELANEEAGGGLESMRTGAARSVFEEGVRESLEGAGPRSRGLEAIIRRFGRPAFFVQDGTFNPDNAPSSSEQVRTKVLDHKADLVRAIPSVGRIDLRDHSKPWVGTGWVVGSDLVVTNRHVAQEFARSKNGTFEFVRNYLGREASASLDFVREHQKGRDPKAEYAVQDIVWIEPDEGHDVALLRVEGVGQAPPEGKKHLDKIALMSDAEYAELPISEWLAVIGYPAQSPWNDFSDQNRIFSGIFDVKRLQPGLVVSKSADGSLLQHDATTLGGNSGSTVIHLATGKAAALHFGGIEGKTNYAVPAPIVRSIVEGHGRTTTSVSVPVSLPEDTSSDGGAVVEIQAPATGGTLSVPVQINIQLANQDEILERTPKVSDYEGRKGYDRDFLEERIDMPVLSGAVDRFGPVARNKLTNAYEIPYTHFSIIMCRRRRLAYVTAVNIDGRRTGYPKSNDVDWAVDPRVDRSAQVENKLYRERRGHDYFQRGHLVRRLDPVWGSKHARQQANDDTFHWTNCAPMHVDFNTGHEWRTIEDGILDSVGPADLRATVFTGPVFHEDDEVHRGVQIPRAYFKIVVHEKPGGGLACAGWVVRQDDEATDIPFERVTTPTSRFEIKPTSLDEIEEMTSLKFDRVLHRVEVRPRRRRRRRRESTPTGRLPFNMCMTRIPVSRANALAAYERPSTPTGLEGATYVPILWDIGARLRVRFLDGTPVMHDMVERFAKEWEQYANVTFDFGEHPDGSDIRISFEHTGPNGDPAGYWSLLGIAAKNVDESELTMSLSNGWDAQWMEDNEVSARGTVPPRVWSRARTDPRTPEPERRHPME